MKTRNSGEKRAENRMQLRRQFVHFALGSALIGTYAFIGSLQAIFLTVFFLFFGILFSFLLKQGYTLPLVWRFHHHLKRGYEERYPLLGAIMFLVGALLAQLVFAKPLVALGAMIVLVYGDSVSTAIGTHFGSMKWVGGKSIEGTLSGLVVSFLFLLALFPAGIAFAAALVGMLGEAVPLEDNIVVPIVTGLALTILL
ncbi:MAG: hypothetical protein WC602_03590 [archaeon]